MPEICNTTDKLSELYSATYYRELVAGLIHKLNNVTTVLSGHTGLLLMSPEELDTEVRDAVEQMSKATLLLSQILDETLIATKTGATQIQAVGVAEFLAAIRPPETLRWSVADFDPGAAVLADPGKLRVVFAYLLDNSRQAGSKQVRCEVTIQDDHHLLRVIDNGNGVKKEIAPRVFQPFFTTKRLPEAFGLGLFRARGEIERMGGTIALKSDGKTGTEVIIRLPAA